MMMATARMIVCRIDSGVNIYQHKIEHFRGPRLEGRRVVCNPSFFVDGSIQIIIAHTVTLMENQNSAWESTHTFAAALLLPLIPSDRPAKKVFQFLNLFAKVKYLKH